jgi:NAD(P)-binding Rossmann-like domain
VFAKYIFPKEKALPIRAADRPQVPGRVVFDPLRPVDRPQEYYDGIKQKFAEARDLRLSYRPDGRAQYTSDLTGELAKYEIDPHLETVLFIGGGFSTLLTAARLRERGVQSIRIVERGGDVGGTWYWNRYPGVACDVSAYDYLPLLSEMNYVPGSFYAKGPEIFAHCQAIVRKYERTRPSRNLGYPANRSNGGSCNQLPLLHQ